MPRRDQPNPPAENFLPPSYSSQLESLESAVHTLDPRPDSGVSVNSQMWQATLLIASSMRGHIQLVRRESKALPSDPSATAAGRERLYRLLGLSGSMVDLGLHFSVDMAARVTGDMEANDPENAAAGYEIGEEIIVERARNAASTVLRAVDTLYQGHDDAPDSVWERANAVHRGGKAKSGPKVKSREYAEFCTLSDEAVEAPTRQPQETPFKPSRFLAVNLFRAVKAAKKDLPNDRTLSGIEMIEKGRSLMENVGALQPEPLELTPAQITAVMGTATKILKHVRNAARADASIGSDPSLRYFSYMLGRMSGGYAISSETAAYRRIAEQTAAQLQQFSS